MTGASEDLLQAVYGLRKAAEMQFAGNAYYQVANEINELIELVGWGDGSITVGKDAAYGFPAMLAEVRKLAGTTTSGSQYNVILYKLDQLASYVTPVASVPTPAAPPPTAEPTAAVAASAPAAPPAPAPAAVSVSTAAPDDLLQAVYGLRKAAEGELTGNAYYQVANEIDALIESLGASGGSVPASQGAAYGFATMIEEVRKLAKTRTAGNQYYFIVCKLDLLASYLKPAAAPAQAAAPVAAPASEKPAPVAAAPVTAAPAAVCPAMAPVGAAPVATPASAPAHTPSAAKPTFADLAAASKARVEAVATSLGITPSHHAAPHHDDEPAAASAELERRSSEPCSMAELAPIVVEPVAAAALPAEAAASPHTAGHPHDAGSPDATGGHAAGGAACPFHALFVAEPAEEPAAEPAPSAHDDLALAAREKIESFDDLASASKAQVEQVAASLGVATAHPAVPSQAEAVEAPSERRLESRSSEAVSQSLVSVEPAIIPGDAASHLDVPEAAPDLGSPAPQGEVVAVEEITVIEVVVAEIAVEPAVAAPPQETPPASEPAAVQKIEAVRTAESEAQRAENALQALA